MLSQAEANAFILLPKAFVGVSAFSMPGGCDDEYALSGVDSPEQFIMDSWRGSLKLSKLKLQNRVRVAEVLVRLDIDGAPHTNPDGRKFGGTHLHVYREGYDAKWAQELDPAHFSDVTSIEQVYRDFCRFCNITPILFQPTINGT